MKMQKCDSMPAKQVYMSIYDINPTESFWDEVDDRPILKERGQLWLKQDLIDNIREHGIKYQLHIDPYGNIKNGNMRYWVARYLLEEENDQRFLFLPVQRNYAAGSFHEEFAIALDQTASKAIAIDIKKRFRFTYLIDDKRLKKAVKQEKIMDNLSEDLGQIFTHDIHKYWSKFLREETLPSATEFSIFEIDPIDEFRMKNFWDQQRNAWALLLQKHPVHANLMIAYGLPGKSVQVPILKEGSPAEQKEFKEWWARTRKGRGSQSSLTEPDYKKQMKKYHGELQTY
jgi:hypothetical protein